MDKKYIVGGLAVIVVAAFLLFGGNITGNVIADGTALDNSEVCTDDDGGVFISKAAILHWKPGGPNDVTTVEKYDDCVDDNRIREQYCDPDDGRRTSAVYTCRKGCVEEEIMSDRIGTATIAYCAS